MTATVDWAEYAARAFDLPKDPLEQIGFEPVCKPRVLARLTGTPERLLPAPCGTCPQERFLALPDEDLDVLYGGAGGGGKGGRCPDRSAPSYNSSIETKVLTPKGFKLIGDVKVGDAVCNPDGTTAKVIKVIDNGQKQFYRVTLADGSSVEADEDHLWAVSISNVRRRRGDAPPPFIPAGLRPEDEWNLRVQSRCHIVNTVELRRLVIRADADKASGTNPRSVQIPLSNPLRMTGVKGRWEVLSPYILGALIGDGSIGGNSAAICGIDPPIFDRIRAELPDHLQLTEKTTGRDCPEYLITRRHLIADEDSSAAFIKELNRLLANRGWRQADLVAAGAGTQGYLSAVMKGSKRPAGKFVERLDEILGGGGSLSGTHADHAGASAMDLLQREGLAGKRSWEKFIPERIKIAPVEDRFAFVQGLMDTDGHMDARGHVEFVSVSERLACDLRDVLHSLGYRATMTTKKTSFTHYGEKKEGRLAYRLYVQGRHMDRLFHMPRKRERVAQFNGGDVEPWHRVVSVEPSGIDNSRCITVDNLNHLYVTDDYIVTHNSASLLALCMRTAVRYPGIQIFWFRKTFPQLNQSVLRNLARYNYGKALGGRWNGSKYELAFPGASILTFAHAKNMEEAAALSSAEINLLVIDERTTMPPDVVDFLYTRIRSGVAGVPCLGARSASNPGHVGHGVVKADYVDATDHGAKEITDKAGRRRIFIPAKATDNPYVGDYDKTLQGIADPDLRARIKDGDWSAMPDAAFPDWKRDRIVVPAFEIPAAWQRFGGMDYGWAAPSVYLAAAKDADGRLWFYRELTMVQTPEADQARQIIAANEGQHVTTIAADPAMWGKTGSSLPPAEKMATEGLWLSKADNDRLGGKARMHTYLAEAPACAHHRSMDWSTCPMLHVIDGSCPQFVKTMGELPRDPRRPEDVDTDAPDHWYDACFVAGTLIATDRGDVPIEEVGTGDRVLTPMGFRRVRDAGRTGADKAILTVAFSDGRSLTGTGNHPVFVEGKGFVRLDALRYLDIIVACQSVQRMSSRSYSTASYSGATRIPPGDRIASITRLGLLIARRGSGVCTRKYGRRRTVRYRLGTTFTTRTTTRTTTRSTTWPASLMSTTASIMEISQGAKPSTRRSRSTASLPQNGMGAPKDWRGTPSMGAELGTAEPIGRWNVPTVVQSSRLATGTSRPGSVRRTARRMPARRAALMTKSVSALAATNPSGSTDTPRRAAAPVSVRGLSDAGRADVYNLSVEGVEEYFANGVLVHNCRYLCMSIGGGPQFPDHDVAVPAEDVGGLPVLEPLGAFAVHDARRDNPDWWTTGEDADAPATRIASAGTAPWH